LASPLFFVLFVSSLTVRSTSLAREINDRPSSDVFSLSTHTTVPGARLELLLHRTASVAGCCHAKALGSRNSKEHFPVPDFPPLSPFLFFSDFFFDLFFSVFLYFTWSLNSRHYSTVFLYQSV
jgi:hypothetical protein